MAKRSFPGLTLNTYVVMRCYRWGVWVRWKDSQNVACPKPKQVISWWGKTIMDGNVEQVGIAKTPDAICPVDTEEAQETHACVFRLPDELKEAMIQEYVIGGTQQQKARACAVDRTTFWRRCERAHVLLLELMNLAAADLLNDENSL